MIHLVLRNPNGDGTFSDALGMTTDNAPHTVNGVVCLPGIIGDDSVSQMESAIDISQARGNVSQGVSWSFDILDWTGSARRSVGILDGGTRFVGWRVAMYLSDTGAETTLTPVCGSADAFQVSDVESSGTRITLSVVSAWTLQAGALGFAYGEQVVGLVAGDHAVSVPTQALPKPVAIKYNAPAGIRETFPSSWDTQWRVGLPGYGAEVAQSSTSATSWLHDLGEVIGVDNLLFKAKSEADADSLRDELLLLLSQNRLAITGQKFSEVPAQIVSKSNTGAASWVEVSVSPFFISGEPDASKVRAHDIQTSRVPVIAGAESIIGWISGNRIAVPRGSQETTEYVTTFSPAILSPSGFISYSLIPCKIGYRNDFTTQPTARVVYYGSTEAIESTGGAVPAETDYASSTLIPSEASKAFTMWGALSAGVITAAAIEFRLIVPNVEDLDFSRYFIDQKLRLVAKNDTSGTTHLNYGWPLNSGPNESTEDKAPGLTYITGIALSGGVETNPYQSFADVTDAQSSGKFIASFPFAFTGDFRFNLEVSAMRLYGVSELAFGSSYAQVQPGASPWWSAPLQPAATAAALLNAVAPASTPNIPKGFDGYPFGLSGWGQYFEPEKTHTEAAVALCEEFWSVLCPDGVDGQSGAGLGEVIEAPSFALGAVEDVVTEPTIEYAPVGGNYTGKAYIAHVDEEFDISNAARFYGGWGEGADDSEFPGGDYGYMIWRACREAYKVHGIRRAATYQFDGVHFAGNVGGYWFEAMRNGARRIEWLAYQPRFVTFKIRESSAPTWWAGNAVTIPTTMAGFAGYNLSAFSTDPVIVVSKTFDPVTMETEYEVALPPVVSTGSTDRIIQTTNVSNDRIVQSLTATDRIIQVIEA